MNYIADEKILAGSFVLLMDNGKVSKMRLPKMPDAIALHDIKKGELVEYSPVKNTKDFAVNNKG
jgi:predicted transcriptional regulator